MNTTTTVSPSTHQPRINYVAASPYVLPALLGLTPEIEKNGIEASLAELVKMRASQINGCVFCLEMHSREARAAGESDERLHLLNAWREAGVFSPREQAALRWTEVLTQLPDHGVSDEIFDKVSEHFSDAELSNLTLLVVAINGWNRFNVAFRVPPRFGG